MAQRIEEIKHLRSQVNACSCTRACSQCRVGRSGLLLPSTTGRKTSFVPMQLSSHPQLPSNATYMQLDPSDTNRIANLIVSVVPVSTFDNKLERKIALTFSGCQTCDDSRCISCNEATANFVTSEIAARPYNQNPKLGIPVINMPSELQTKLESCECTKSCTRCRSTRSTSFQKMEKTKSIDGDAKKKTGNEKQHESKPEQQKNQMKTSEGKRLEPIHQQARKLINTVKGKQHESKSEQQKIQEESFKGIYLEPKFEQLRRLIEIGKGKKSEQPKKDGDTEVECEKCGAKTGFLVMKECIDCLTELVDNMGLMVKMQKQLHATERAASRLEATMADAAENPVGSKTGEAGIGLNGLYGWDVMEWYEGRWLEGRELDPVTDSSSDSDSE